MGSASGYICRTCGTRFQVRSGGGFFFDLLHCEACGEAKSVGHQRRGGIETRKPRACSMTDSAKAFKRLSAAEALRASTSTSRVRRTSRRCSIR